MNKPTQPMVDYATDLLEQLGYDPDEYDFDKMSYGRVAELIDELRDKLSLSRKWKKHKHGGAI